MAKINKIGVLTSGGDAPGMNAAIRAVVRSAYHYGLEIVGVHYGYRGLMQGDISPLGMRSVSSIIQRGGTILHTARCLEFATPEGVKTAVETARSNGIDGLVVIGGDGSFRGAKELSEAGLPTIGIPGTIDNDIACTDYTIGFDTACNIAVEAIDRLRDTSESHNRCSVVEVMGHNAGYLALDIGVASGALAVLIPERECDLKREIYDKIEAHQKSHYIVVVSEGCKMSSAQVAKHIEDNTGMTTRLTVLGHIQRGGAPSALDRVNAIKLGFRSVDLLHKGIGNRVVAIRSSELIDFDIQEALDMKKTIPEDLYKIAQIVSM